METHNRQKHPEPCGITDDPDFIELCRIARRLPAGQRDQLSEYLLTDQLSEAAAEFDIAIGIFNDENPFDFSELESFDFTEGSD